MIFQHTWRLILENKKTETRRPVKPGERLLFSDDTNTLMVLGANGRVKWEVGKTYAVQPGRGKLTAQVHKDGFAFEPERIQDGGYYESGFWYPFDECAPLRILITWISIGRLRDINEAGAIAEGAQLDSEHHTYTFLNSKDYISARGAVNSYAQLWTTINTRKGIRWQDNPRVFTLTFERVEGEEVY